jgi:hypothetical protein
MDLFAFDNQQWIILADYYSKFPIVRKLPNPAPREVVINIVKQVFSEFGVLERVISDNGPYFASRIFKPFMQQWCFDI